MLVRLVGYHSFMLDDLDAIDWSKINHCYGPATDIPGTLRALATGDKKQRKEALWELHGNIWHQGSVYEASAFAVPFLLELVRNKHADSLEILGLLAVIADGRSHLAVHGRRANPSDREFEQQLARELKWVADAKAAVGKGRDLFLELLGGEDHRVRELSGFLLGLTPRGDADEIDAVAVIEKIHGLES